MKEDLAYLGNEIWKQHPALPIQVSNMARVKKEGEIVTPRKQNGNCYYWRVSVGQGQRRRRHRLVGETWLNAGPDDCVLHRDEELPPHLIDCVDNLWIGDRVDNYKDRDAKGRLKGKKKNRIPDYYRRKIHALRKLGLILREISEILGINEKSAGNILARDPDDNYYIGDAA